MSHIFPCHNPLTGFGFATEWLYGCAGPHLWYHHPQSCNIRAQGFPTSFPFSPIQLLGAQPLASQSGWVSTAHCGDFAFIAFYFMPRGDDLKLLGVSGSNEMPG